MSFYYEQFLLNVLILLDVITFERCERFSSILEEKILNLSQLSSRKIIENINIFSNMDFCVIV